MNPDTKMILNELHKNNDKWEKRIDDLNAKWEARFGDADDARRQASWPLRRPTAPGMALGLLRP
jgi:hypothetical protein